MTIKRRLSISNVLMLVLPVILTMMLIGSLFLVYTGITGIEGIKTFRYENMFFAAIDDAGALTKKWTDYTDLEKMKSDINRFNKNYNKNSIYLMLYKDNELIYPDIDKIVPDIAPGGDKYALVGEDISVYSNHINGYTIILLDEKFNISYAGPVNGRIYFGGVGLIFLIFAILSINRMLTRFVFGSIMTSLNTLVNGVHEIRDGNLSYRIRYGKNDEFAAVCADFNDMAAQLSDIVEARRKDEANRRGLIAGISHDLRTPLTSIKAYLEGIEKGVASTPEARKRYIEIIKSEANDMEHIIGQLFQFSKLDTGEFPFLLKPADIGKELAELIESGKKKYEDEGLIISLIQNTENMYAEIDPVQFRNVIHNILGNSVKYKSKDFAKTEIICRRDMSNIIITLTDNGSGVPEDALDKLFEVFYRSDTSRSNPNQGSGLGLAISKKIIECFGGTIGAENAAGGGLSVIISLPIIPEEKHEKNIDN